MVGGGVTVQSSERLGLHSRPPGVFGKGHSPRPGGPARVGCRALILRCLRGAFPVLVICFRRHRTRVCRGLWPLCLCRLSAVVGCPQLLRLHRPQGPSCGGFGPSVGGRRGSLGRPVIPSLHLQGRGVSRCREPVVGPGFICRVGKSPRSPLEGGVAGSILTVMQKVCGTPTRLQPKLAAGGGRTGRSGLLCTRLPSTFRLAVFSSKSHRDLVPGCGCGTGRNGAVRCGYESPPHVGSLGTGRQRSRCRPLRRTAGLACGALPGWAVWRSAAHTAPHAREGSEPGGRRGLLGRGLQGPVGGQWRHRDPGRAGPCAAPDPRARRVLGLERLAVFLA